MRMWLRWAIYFMPRDQVWEFEVKVIIHLIMLWDRVLMLKVILFIFNYNFPMEASLVIVIVLEQWSTSTSRELHLGDYRCTRKQDISWWFIWAMSIERRVINVKRRREVHRCMMFFDKVSNFGGQLRTKLNTSKYYVDIWRRISYLRS